MDDRADLAMACAVASSYFWQSAAKEKNDTEFCKYLVEQAIVFGNEATAMGNCNHPGSIARDFMADSNNG